MAVIIGLMLARNEDWVIGLTARAALMWCDHLVILNHASNDRTFSIAADVAQENPGCVTLLHESDEVWREMQYRQRMLDAARYRGGTHMVVIDADEILSGNLIPEVRSYIETLPDNKSLEPPWVALRGSISRYHTSGVWGTNWASLAFTDKPEYHWSARNGYDFHHRRPMGQAMESSRPWQQGRGGLLHLQFLSDRRLRAKQACYKMQEVLRWPERDRKTIDKMYSVAVYGCPGDTFAEVPGSWWEPYQDWMEYLKIDAEPWQERQCKQWMKEHGPQKFQGLDLFGVV